VRVLAWLTVAWLVLDGAVGMGAGLAADSVALVGWGLDCAVQAAAALVVLWRFAERRVDSVAAERLAHRAVGVSFLLLAPYIVVVAVDHLVTGDRAGVSWLGIGLAAADAVLMPLLGRAKERVGTALGSTATRSEGRQNVLCAYLSVAVLAGLAANALAGWWWADPTMALLVSVVVVQTGVRTLRSRELASC
jgi:divalent metal cation (Fe/Co/Zn/Cd) transporter